MTNKIIILIFSLLWLNGQAQIQQPVKWSYLLKKNSNNVYEIQAKATIEKGWHVYSQNTPNGGPIPTEIKFSQNPLIEFQGVTKEIGKLEQRHEALFGVDVKQFSNTVNFVQLFKLKAAVKTTINGAITFMVCNDSQCLPPTTINFSLAVQ